MEVTLRGDSPRMEIAAVVWLGSGKTKIQGLPRGCVSGDKVAVIISGARHTGHGVWEARQRMRAIGSSAGIVGRRLA